MKIFIVLLLICGITFSTCGCGNKNPGGNSASSETVNKELKINIKNTPELYYGKETNPNYGNGSFNVLSPWTELPPML